MNISFSIDDVIGSLLWLERTSAGSIFDSHTFAFAQWLYDKYHISTTCNCLYSDGTSNLAMVSDKFKSEFEFNSSWLKFAFHGWNYEKSYAYASYEDAMDDIRIVESEIKRICGEKALSKVVRTHFFSGSKAAVKAWKDEGVKEFLTADDDRGGGTGINYDLSNEEILELKANHSIRRPDVQFTKTDIRLENYMENNNWTLPKERSDFVVFTHERFINEDWLKTAFRILLDDNE